MKRSIRLEDDVRLSGDVEARGLGVRKHRQRWILCRRWRLREPCLLAGARIHPVLLLGSPPERDGHKQDRCKCL